MENQPDYRYWALIIAGVSLIWNLGNTIYTRRIDTKHKARSIQLDEFRYSVRDPINKALTSCDDCTKRLKGLITSNRPLSEMKNDSTKLNRAVIEATNNLSDCLDTANKSKFSSGSRWLEPFDEVQDKILGSFDRGLNEAHNEQSRRSAFETAHQGLCELKVSIVELIEAELLNYTK